MRNAERLATWPRGPRPTHVVGLIALALVLGIGGTLYALTNPGPGLLSNVLVWPVLALIPVVVLAVMFARRRPPTPEEVQRFEANVDRAMQSMDETVYNSHVDMREAMAEGRAELAEDIARFRAENGLPARPTGI